MGCRNGGCGVCKVQIVQGQYVSRVMSRDHVSAEDEAKWALSCRVRPASDITLRVLGTMKKNVCRLVNADLLLSPQLKNLRNPTWQSLVFCALVTPFCACWTWTSRFTFIPALA